MKELIGGPCDGQVVDLPKQKYGPYVLQMVHIWGWAQPSMNHLVEYHLGTDGNYHYFAQAN